MKLEDGGYPELKSDLKQFLNSGKWQPELQSGQRLCTEPDKEADEGHADRSGYDFKLVFPA